MFIQLLLAHMLGDFVLQPAAWVKSKEEKKLLSPWLYVHSALHGLLAYLLLVDYSKWPIALLVAFTHFAVDALKLVAQTPKTKTPWFIADQLLHLAALLFIFNYYASPNLAWVHANRNELLLYIAAVLFLSFVSAIIVQQLMAPWTSSTAKTPNDSLAKAGKYIGMLERLFVFVFVLSGHWEGIGFLIAAKSVFRFVDLRESKDRKLTEYILIGTLLSFALAITTGMLVLYLVQKPYLLG